MNTLITLIYFLYFKQFIYSTNIMNMDKITKNPALNNFLLKYNKRNWNQIVLKLSLIALSYLRTLVNQNNYFSLNDLDQVLFKLESVNISRMGNKLKKNIQTKKEKKELFQIYKPPIDNQLKSIKTNEDKKNYYLQEEYNNEKKKLLKQEDNKDKSTISEKKENNKEEKENEVQNEKKIKKEEKKENEEKIKKEEIKNNDISSNSIKTDNINKKQNLNIDVEDPNFKYDNIDEPFLNTDKYDEHLSSIPKFIFPSYKKCTPCHPCHDIDCSKCNYSVGNTKSSNNKKKKSKKNQKNICEDCK